MSEDDKEESARHTYLMKILLQRVTLKVILAAYA